MGRFGNWLRERFIFFWARVRKIHYSDNVTKHGDRKDKMSWTIYGGKGEEVGFHFKKQFFVHMFLKYGILSTCVRLVHKIMGKYIECKVAKESYNVNLEVFDKAYESSIEDWCKVYMQVPDVKDPTKFKDKGVKCYEHYRNSWTGAKRYKRHRSTLITMKHLAMAIVMNDTAYFEFFNILMYNMAQGMFDEYHKGYKDGKMVIKDKVDVKHLFYSHSNTMDTTYYAIMKTLQDQRKNELIVDVMSLPKTKEINKPDFVQSQLKVMLDNLGQQDNQLEQQQCLVRERCKAIQATLAKLNPVKKKGVNVGQ